MQVLASSLHMMLARWGQAGAARGGRFRAACLPRRGQLCARDHRQMSVRGHQQVRTWAAAFSPVAARLSAQGLWLEYLVLVPPGCQLVRAREHGLRLLQAAWAALWCL